MRPNPQETADLVTFTKEILIVKLHFLCSEKCANLQMCILTLFQISGRGKNEGRSILQDTHFYLASGKMCR